MPISAQAADFPVNNIDGVGDQKNGSITQLSDGRFVVTWDSASVVHARVYFGDGTPVGDEFAVNSTIAGSQTDSATVALADGRFMVFFGSDGEVRGRLFDSDGTPVAGDFQVNTDHGFDAVPEVAALPDGTIFLTFGASSAIYGHRFDANGNSLGNDFLVSQSASFTYYSDVTALSDGRVFATWTDSGGVFGRLFEANGTPAGDQYLVAAGQSGVERHDTTTLTDGSIVVTWMRSAVPASDILVTLLSPAGVPSGTEIVLGQGAFPKVAGLADGRFVVSWNDHGHMSAQLYLPDGSRLGDPIIVDTGGFISNYGNALHALDDGRFVVSWSDDFDTDNGGADTGLHARIFDPTIFNGTSGADTWTGGSLTDHITGGGDADILSGMGGDDFISGDAGNDTLYGGDGNDKLFGGTGDDHLYSGNGNDSLYGGDGANDQDVLYVGNETTAHVKILSGGAGGYDTLATSWTGPSFFYDLRNDAVSGIEFLALGSATGPVGTSGTARLILNAAQLDGVGYIVFRAPGVDSTIEIMMADRSTLDLSGKGMSLSAFANSAPNSADHLLITGGGSSETITGTVIADTIRGNGGKDTLDGSDGLDTADYSDKTKAVKVTLNAGTFADVYVGGTSSGFKEDRIRNIEGLIGGSAADNFKGDGLANSFRGNAGKDTLDGAGGIDTADYSDKTKKIEVALNKATAVIVKVNGVAEDSIKNIENIVGGSAGDKLTGDSLANMFHGGGGNDTIDGGAGSDTADYSEKTAAIILNLAVLSSGYTSVTIGGIAEDKIKNIENIIGGSAADTLTGNSSANFFNGGLGNDTIDGGLGLDTSDYSNRSGAVIVNLDLTNPVIVSVGGTAEDTISNIENIIGGFGSDALTGDSADNSLVGGNGLDTLTGGLGKDTLRGGDLDDTLVINSQADVVANEIYDGGTGTDTLVIGSQGGDAYSIDLQGVSLNSIEKVTFNFPEFPGTVELTIGASQLGTGLSSNAVIHGDAYPDDTHLLHIVGDTASIIDLSQLTFDTNFATDAADGITVAGAGISELIRTSVLNDTISAGNGNDTIFAGYGFDEGTSFLGGYDKIDGEGGSDWVDFSHVTGSTGIALTLDGSTPAVISYNSVATGEVANIENIVGTSASQGDALTGDGSANVFRGMDGNDTLDGGGGPSDLNDTADYSYVTSPHAVQVALLDTNPSDVYVFSNVGSVGPILEHDQISNIENIIGGAGDDILVGNSAANVFTGNGGADTLSGGAGNDTLIGGLGNDLLTGGANADHFRFDTTPNSSTNVDHITDFISGTDKIEIENDIFAVGSGLAANEFTSKSGHVFTTTTQRLIYDQTAHELWYDANGSAGGGAGPIKVAIFDNAPANLLLSDFLVV